MGQASIFDGNRLLRTLVTEAGPLFQRLTENGFHLAPELVTAVLEGTRGSLTLRITNVLDDAQRLGLITFPSSLRPNQDQRVGTRTGGLRRSFLARRA